MKWILFCSIFFSGYSSFAQSSDFILLKKKDKTITSYYPGNHISFTTTNGTPIDADITQIKNDTIYLQQYVVQQMPTTLGVYILDTTNSYRFQFNYNEIKSISLPVNHFDLTASGASLFGGGVLLAIASGIVYLADRKDYSPGLLIGGAALATAGYFIGKKSGKGITIGKKFQLLYIDTTNKK
jgi:hypothetical protein